MRDETQTVCTNCGKSLADEPKSYEPKLLARAIPLFYAGNRPSGQVEETYVERAICRECCRREAEAEVAKRRQGILASFAPIVGATVRGVDFDGDENSTKITRIELVAPDGKEWLVVLELDCEDGWLEALAKEDYDAALRARSERATETAYVPMTIHFRHFSSLPPTGEDRWPSGAAYPRGGTWIADMGDGRSSTAWTFGSEECR